MDICLYFLIDEHGAEVSDNVHDAEDKAAGGVEGEPAPLLRDEPKIFAHYFNRCSKENVKCRSSSIQCC